MHSLYLNFANHLGYDYVIKIILLITIKFRFRIILTAEKSHLLGCSHSAELEIDHNDKVLLKCCLIKACI